MRFYRQEALIALEIVININTILIAITVIAVITVLCTLIWLSKSKKNERQLKQNLQTQYRNSNLLLFNELCNSGKGTVIEENESKVCIVPLHNTKRHISAVNYVDETYTFWTYVENDTNLEQERYLNNSNIEIEIVENDSESYIIDEIKHSFDDILGVIQKTPMVKAFIGKSMMTNIEHLVDTFYVESEKVPTKYQLIHIHNGKVDTAWYSTQKDAQTHMKQQLDKIGSFRSKNAKKNMVKLQTNGKSSYLLTKDYATLIADNSVHFWLILGF